ALAITASSAAVGTWPHDQIPELLQLPDAVEVQVTRGIFGFAARAGAHSKGIGALSDSKAGPLPVRRCPLGGDGCWMNPACLARSACRSSASISACAASSSSENGDTTAGCGAAACPEPAAAGLTTTLLPPPAGADLKPDANSTADTDISDRARMI